MYTESKDMAKSGTRQRDDNTSAFTFQANDGRKVKLIAKSPFKHIGQAETFSLLLHYYFKIWRTTVLWNVAPARMSYFQTPGEW